MRTSSGPVLLLSLLLSPLAATLVACGPGGDPMARVDDRYTEIAVSLGIADRDTARNIRNREARDRKTEVEKARMEFFADPAVKATIEGSRGAPEGTLERIRADAYWREAVLVQAWTETQRAEEARLLARLEEAKAADATWSSPDATVQLSLEGSWRDVSEAADALAPELRAVLAKEYVDHSLRPLGEDLVALVKLRNEVAKGAGYDSYWHLALAQQGLEPLQVEQMINEIAPVVMPLQARAKETLGAKAAELGLQLSFANLPLLRRSAGLEAGRAEADLAFDADLAEERITTALRDMGISTEGWQVYTGPRRYTRSGVYGYAIRPPEHVAIVMSQDQRWSLWQYEALAHEGGHAVWWNHLPHGAVQSPVLWQPPSPWFEGFAMFFERLIYEPDFAARYVPELPAEQREALARWRARSMADWIVDYIVETEVERRLYEDPSDLRAIQHFAATRRAQLTGLPQPPADERGYIYDDALLSSVLWVYPAYSQNYLFAYATEAWLWDAVQAKVGGEILANPEVGKVIIGQLIQQPPTMSFPQRVEAIAATPRSEALQRYLQAAWQQ